MTQTMLVAVLRLFALLSSMRGDAKTRTTRSMVERYLEEHLSLHDREEHLLLFDDFLDMAMAGDDQSRKQGAWDICTELCSNLPREEHYILLANILSLFEPDDNDATTASILASALDMDWDVLQNLANFIHHPSSYHRLGQSFLVQDREAAPDECACTFLNLPSFNAAWTLLHIRETGTMLIMPTRGTLTINGRLTRTGHFQVLPQGGLLRDGMGRPCYYSDISKVLHLGKQSSPVVFEGRELDFRFPGSDNGLHHFSFKQGSGQLIGIMGGSGTGKSTLLSILNGTLPPDSGTLLINGRDLYADDPDLEGVIGYVPQDDLLFEDLTVAQNLYYNARLCLNNLSPEETGKRVEKTLIDLGQVETSDLKVGSSLDKTISGGQRKRLNIALELIREPAILFADEPTSGLSSSDSLNVISLLREQANNGCLVFVVIHQPSFQIFQMFDSLWVLDKGGRPIYDGNPMEAITYFRTAAQHSGAEECMCPTCGNVNPEQIFEIIEMKRVDERGRFTRDRLVSPEAWHQRYLECKQAAPEHERTDPTNPPPRRLWRPGLWGQFTIFLTRNLLTRVANRQYMFINMLEAPLIGLVLAWLCRGSSGEKIPFVDNVNIAMFFFMSVIVAIFMGLSVSAEEIVRDRTILKREQFLSLSRFGYLNGKCAFLAGMTAIQVLGFMLVSFPLLDIPNMYLPGFAVLFSAGFCSCLVGLNVSASLKSVVAIYILVPLLLIPQMLLCGSVIDFNELSSRENRDNYVPLYAGIMPSRWGYEALVTEQYVNNRYMAPLFDLDCKLRQIDFDLDYRLEEIKSLADRPFMNACNTDKKNNDKESLRTARNEIRKLEARLGMDSGLNDQDFDPQRYGRSEQKTIRNFVLAAAKELRNERKNVFAAKQQIQKDRKTALGTDGIRALKHNHTNTSVTRVVLGSMGLTSLRVQNGHVVQLSSPICKPPSSSLGRAHFGAATKRVGSILIPTFWFNLGMLWLLTLLLYLCLYADLINRMAARLARCLGKRS
jgi:ABC-type multidrug transport system ATPase subunit